MREQGQKENASPRASTLRARLRLMGLTSKYLAQRSDNRGLQPPKRRHIEMIVMVVADQNQIDRRKVLESNARWAMPSRSGKWEWRDALRPDRIGQDVDSIELQQCGRVIDEGDTQAALIDARRRWRAEQRVGSAAPLARLPVEHPLQERTPALPAALVVVESLAVEMIGHWAAIVRRGEEGALNGHHPRRRGGCNRDGFGGATHPIYPMRPLGNSEGKRFVDTSPIGA